MATYEMEQRPEDVVVQKLNELFGNVLNIDIIKSVASSCQFDVQESSNKLLEITSTVYDAPSNRIAPSKSQQKAIQGIGTTNTPIRPSASTPSLGSDQQKSRKAKDIERALKNIHSGYRVLILLRGVPGCGKSHLAQHIINETVGRQRSGEHILSTDDYFNRSGSYIYNANLISEAHGWNHNRAFLSMSRGLSPVIVDNTNTQMWEMKPYATMATDFGYIIEILEPDTHWCFNDKELARRNTHGVPKAKIKDMIERFDRNITAQKLLNAFNLEYRLNKPPQMRNYPPWTKSKSVTSLRIAGDTNGGTAACSSGRRRSNCGAINLSNSVTILNQQQQNCSRNNHPVQTINLMDFNDDFAAAVGTTAKAAIRSDSSTTVSSFNLNSVDNILMWDQGKVSPSVPAGFAADSSTGDVAENNKKKWPGPSFNLESAWGVNEAAIRSWDIVTPLADEENAEGHSASGPTSATVATTTVDSECNTIEEDFHLASSSANVSDVKIMTGQNRNINLHTPKKGASMPQKIMVDKSSATDCIVENETNHISYLANMFPHIPLVHLKYWYGKCKGDLEWTIELLLDEKPEALGSLADQADEAAAADAMPVPMDNAEEVDNADSKPAKRKMPSDQVIELKKCLESKVNISNDFYSDKLLKVKNGRYGGALQTDVAATTSAAAPEVILIDSDVEELDEDDLMDVTMVRSESKAPEMIELNLGEAFVAQLESKFGDPTMVYPRGFLPVVQVPVGLARQMYTFYIESVYQQMDAQNEVLEVMIKEDEEMAKRLQAQEFAPTVPEPPNLQQIMGDQQAAAVAHKREVEQWKNLTPDTLAAKLTKQKLFSVFPTIDQELLVEILHANGDSYQETVDTVLASVGGESISAAPEIREPPINEAVINEMREAQKDNEVEDSDEPHTATYYRDEANHYLERRAGLYKKAQQYLQRGMTEVAQFYFGLAARQTDLFDQANNMAATSFLDEHSKRLQDFNTLDLHFLYVKEAIPALDLFIDRSINLLKGSNAKKVEQLQIITGRGKRSANGISKIKPAVIARLKKRGLKFVELNPGLLKIKIVASSLVTSDIS